MIFTYKNVHFTNALRRIRDAIYCRVATLDSSLNKKQVQPAEEIGSDPLGNAEPGRKCSHNTLKYSNNYDTITRSVQTTRFCFISVFFTQKLFCFVLVALESNRGRLGSVTIKAASFCACAEDKESFYYIGRVVSAELAAPECRWDAQHTPDFDTKAQTRISRAEWIKILGIKYMKGLRVK